MSKTFTRDPLPSDWEKFMRYTGRVEHFVAYDDHEDHSLSNETWGRIGLTRPQLNIFPALQHASMSLSSFQPLFMTDTVSCLTLHLNIDESPRSIRLFEDLTAWAHRYLPYLQELHVLSPLRGDQFLQPIARLVSGFPCLRVVDLPCQPISTSLLGAFGALPYLEHILVDRDADVEFWVRDLEEAREEERSVAIDRLSLTKLRTVCLGAVSFEGLTRIVDDIHFSARSLTSISIQIGIGSTATPLGLRSLLLSMAAKCRSLETLQIRFKLLRRRGGEPYALADESLHVDDLIPFTEIATLIHFSIAHPLPILADFHDIHLLASRCGRFESIWLNPCPEKLYHSPLLTLAALTPFAVFCPHLRRLGLCMDFSLPSHFFLGSVQFLRLEEIFIGFSVLVSTLEPKFQPERWMRIAEYLSSILPLNCFISSPYDFRLDGIDRFARRAQTFSSVDWTDEKEWATVQSILRALQRERIEFEEDMAGIRAETRMLENVIEGKFLLFLGTQRFSSILSHSVDSFVGYRDGGKQY